MRTQLPTMRRLKRGAGPRMFVTIHQMAAKWHKTWTRHFPSLSLQSARPTGWDNKQSLSLDFSQARQSDAARGSENLGLSLRLENRPQINCAHAQLFAHILNGPSFAQWMVSGLWSLVPGLRGQCTFGDPVKGGWRMGTRGTTLWWHSVDDLESSLGLARPP